MTSSAKTAAARVTQMLSLRSIVQCMPVLAKALQGSRSQLLQIIQEVSEHPNSRIESVCADCMRR